MNLTSPNTIQYVFRLGQEELVFTIKTDQNALEGHTAAVGSKYYPSWTKLSSNQCPNCPLKTTECKYCPAAIRVHEVLSTFKTFASFEKIDLSVVTHRRIFHQQCDLQSALNSMLGLQMATSGCPILEKLRIMANFHMPFCSFAETLYRTVSAYLTQQFFVDQEGGDADWKLNELKAFYQQLEILNRAFSHRIKVIEENDAVSNAIIMFFSASIVVADAIDDGLAEYKDYFTGKSAQAPLDQ
ncbi:hypothetical protein QEH59_05665 [Coraliomargarita sp. SDUM461004]|uniref:Uncharacterized protein n=1 Tax=Thalassobacterium sedimentorum TaxID=3041258 RepID=A0ABU1AGD7_9BACT|nr:hypothetical protein [Coraliomargarita sp. SDUM461004]MDQ8193901.1 hypothetical protein [Coraliomargarita sp. SDUM461004]